MVSRVKAAGGVFQFGTVAAGSAAAFARLNQRSCANATAALAETHGRVVPGQRTLLDVAAPVIILRTIYTIYTRHSSNAHFTHVAVTLLRRASQGSISSFSLLRHWLYDRRYPLQRFIFLHVLNLGVLKH